MCTEHARPYPAIYAALSERVTRKKEKDQTIYDDCVEGHIPKFGNKNKYYLNRNVTLSFHQDSLSENDRWHND